MSMISFINYFAKKVSLDSISMRWTQIYYMDYLIEYFPLFPEWPEERKYVLKTFCDSYENVVFIIIIATKRIVKGAKRWKYRCAPVKRINTICNRGCQLLFWRVKNRAAKACIKMRELCNVCALVCSLIPMKDTLLIKIANM